MLCTGSPDGSVTVLDGATLKRKRSFGAGVTAGPAVNADGLVAVVSGQLVSAYDLASGERRWSLLPTLTEGAAQEVYFAGDRVLAAAKNEVVSIPAAGPASDEDYESFEAKLPDGFALESGGRPLASGGAAFVSFPDGFVFSAYLP
ncbi:hypothetical protein O1L60_24485 [Streptomyces diastatochromogenes]|nr:hypothetical protein [Streptomyces diastatochromogenes]